MAGIFSLQEVRTEQLANIDSGLALNIPGLLYGYFGGGNVVTPAVPTPTTTRYSTINRIDFTTETVTTPTPKLSTVRVFLSGTSSNSYGYFGGNTSLIDRLDFSTETVTIPSQKLTQARQGLAAISNAN